jgi:hypothetical protein
MIDSRLIWYQHYFDWADEVIASLSQPPYWLIDIATIKYYAEAVPAINKFVHSEPFEQFDWNEHDNEYIACLFLRFKRTELSWATFLELAGRFTDGANRAVDCSYFSHRLNEFSDASYTEATRTQQISEVTEEFKHAISIIEPIYADFDRYFRGHIQRTAK